MNKTSELRMFLQILIILW